MAENPKTKAVKFIRKSNNLVEGRFRFDIWEMRIFVKMLTIIHRDDEDFKRYRIYLKEIISEFELEKNNRSYEELKKGAEKLASREIRIPMLSPKGEAMELFTHIVSGAKSFVDSKQGKYIEVDFHPDMKPYLLQLQTKFLMYDVRNVLKLPSSFSIRIYELLKQYETIGKRKMNVEEIKEMLDIKDKYSLYANLKQRVIIKAQMDLEAFTDIKFTFEEVKRGKSVEEIVFYIFKNADVIDKREGNTEVVIEYQLTEKDVTATQIYNLIKQYKGSSKLTVESWVNTYPVEHIINRINFVKNQINVGKVIKNPMGLLQKMMIESNLFDPIQEEIELQEQNIQKAKQVQESKQNQISKEKQLQQAKEKYEQNKTELMRSLFETNPGLAKDFLLDFKTKRNLPDAPFIIQLAYDHYTTNINGILPESKDEIMYNYNLGGSFSALLTEWFENNFSREMTTLRNDFE
ncbi:hypothetical protein EMA8858_03819 [Emticicia aquatica]|uniref:Initiator Rep protein WH1 domain-containing protein n=1 Tax=Emticicia aquatica TaxID=1681835 RepID=A0ABN8F2P3_9BACT|nr:replication initiation protein [Emticicia aquatica]CAH0997685.1 hypothetical protein EMA8858_03819 [Emticicia aquatica]